MPARDHFLIVSAVLVVMLSIVLLLAVVNKPPGTNGPYSLTDSEKQRAAAIAVGDVPAGEKIGDVVSKFSWQEGMIFNTTNPRFYRVGTIAVGQFHEVAPGIDRIRYLPSVELIMGNESQGDINIYLFVDLSQARVVYVGFTSRAGPDAGQYSYMTRYNGVTGNIHGQPSINYENVTILNGGYTNFQALTEIDRSRLFGIAMGNATVSRFLSSAAAEGESPEITYRIHSAESKLNDYYFIDAYPELFINVRLPDAGFKELAVAFDGSNNTVTSLQQDEFHPPPPTPAFQSVDRQTESGSA